MSTDKFVELESTDEGPSQTLSQRSVGSYSNISLGDENDSEMGSPAPKKTRGTINIFENIKVVAALDKCGISDRDAVHLVTAIAEALNVDLQTLILNRSSIRRYRQNIREVKAKEVKKNFLTTELNALVLHWDGKLFYDMLQREMVERLPVVVTNGETERLLGVPKIQDSKGATQAVAVYEVLEDWGLHTAIKALCCDTTASNLGVRKGAATLLERRLKTKLLYLPCRHHIFELVLRSVFEKKMPGTVGPNVPIFGKFQNAWSSIDKKSYQIGIIDQTVKHLIKPDKIFEIGSFVRNVQTNLLPRDDYRELLQLTLIFLGLIPAHDIFFNIPGAFHHARWMAKAIYCLKMFIFRDAFITSTNELNAIRDTCVFIVLVYIQAWFTCPVPTRAPAHDLQFMKNLYNYRSIDEEISTVTLEKFKNHLWYLNPESAAMALFDNTLSFEVKRKMVSNLHPITEMDNDFFNRFPLISSDIIAFCQKEIHDFITPQSRNFLARFNISDDFLEVDPKLWDDNPSYLQGLNVVTHLKIVNDVAERGINLFTQYNNRFTRNEEQKQFSLLVINEYRKKFPNANKETLMKIF